MSNEVASSNPTRPWNGDRQVLRWRFPRTFWFANGAELCERAAYYGMYITIWRYLNDSVGFRDVEVGIISTVFVSSLYLLPVFMGILADQIGFKNALLLAFALLTGGYGLLGAYQHKATALLALGLIVLGGATIKPVITGTVAKTSDSVNRARAMSIFYMVVNIGSFTGKTVAGPFNERLGLQFINLYAAAMTATAFLLVALFYKDVDRAGVGRSFAEVLRSLGRVVTNLRFMCLILIVAGFWGIQFQLYSTMPSYIERILGTGYKPEWLANINPLVVVLCVVPITQLVRGLPPANSIGIALLIIPFTALVMGLSPVLAGAVGNRVELGWISLHPVVLMFIVGIGLQGFAECFLSPKWLEFASKQAPRGEVGLYMGYAHLTSAFSPLFSNLLAGFLLAGYCPDPKTLAPEVRDEWRLATDPYYRFRLDDAAAATLDAGPSLGPALRARFAANGIDLDVNARLTPGADLARATGRIVRSWTVTTPAGPYKIAQLEYENGGKRVDVGAKVVEHLVFAPTAPLRSEMPPLPSVYAKAHHVWYVFTGVGFAAFLALLVFRYVTNRRDARKLDATATAGT